MKRKQTPSQPGYLSSGEHYALLGNTTPMRTLPLDNFRTEYTTNMLEVTDSPDCLGFCGTEFFSDHWLDLLVLTHIYEQFYKLTFVAFSKIGDVIYYSQ